MIVEVLNICRNNTYPWPEKAPRTRPIGTVHKHQFDLGLFGHDFETKAIVEQVLLVVANDANQLVKMLWIPFDALQGLMATASAPPAEVGACVALESVISCDDQCVFSLLLLFLFSLVHEVLV